MAWHGNLKKLIFRWNPPPFHDVNEESSDSWVAAVAKIYGLEQLQVFAMLK
jgi:hypothetical protein